MTVTFRPARADNVPAIVALLSDDELGRQRETAEFARYHTAFAAMEREPNNLIVVGEAEGRVVACYQLTAITGLSLAATRRAQIEGIRVDASLRGQGVGAALMRDAEARARALGCGLLQLTTNAMRKDAYRFYERLGFTASHIGFKRGLT